MASNKNPKHKRKDLSGKQKIEILDKINQGFTVEDIAKEYGIAERTVYNIKSKRKEIRATYNSFPALLSRKRHKPSERQKEEKLQVPSKVSGEHQDEGFQRPRCPGTLDFRELADTLKTQEDWSNALPAADQFFHVPIAVSTKARNVNVDRVTEKIFRRQSVTNIIPIDASKDGSCLFNSVCWLLFGSEDKAFELRVRNCIFMQNNANLLNLTMLRRTLRNNLTEQDLDMILQSSIAERDFVVKDSVRAIKNHSRSMLDSRKYSSMVDIFFLSQLLSVEIEVIYPSHNNPYTKRELFSGTIRPEGAAVRRIVISWTSTDDSSIDLLGQGTWRPNHFVPCICKENMDESASSKLPTTVTELSPEGADGDADNLPLYQRCNIQYQMCICQCEDNSSALNLKPNFSLSSDEFHHQVTDETVSDDKNVSCSPSEHGAEEMAAHLSISSVDLCNPPTPEATLAAEGLIALTSPTQGFHPEADANIDSRQYEPAQTETIQSRQPRRQAGNKPASKVVQLVRPIMDIAQSPLLTDEATMAGQTIIQRGSTHMQSTDTISLQEGTFCSIHSAEQSSVGCENCCEMFCCNCLNSPTTCCSVTDTSHKYIPLSQLAERIRSKLEPLISCAEEKLKRFTEVISQTSDLLTLWDEETGDGVRSIHLTRDQQIQAINEKYKQLETEYIQRRRESKESVYQYNIKYTDICEEMKKIRDIFDPYNRISLLKEKTQIERKLSEMMESQHGDLFVPNHVIEYLHTVTECRDIEVKLTAAESLIISLRNQSVVQNIKPPSVIETIKTLSIDNLPRAICHYKGVTYLGSSWSISQIDYQGNQKIFTSLQSGEYVESIRAKNNQIFVIQNYQSKRRLCIYNMLGQLITSWYHPESYGYMYYRNKLALLGSHVIVGDVSNNRLTVYSLTGDIIRHIPCTQHSYHSCICEAGDDSVIISNYFTDTVYKLNLTTEEIEWTCTRMMSPMAVVRYAKRYVLVTDQYRTSISVLDINTGEVVQELNLDYDDIQDIQVEGDQLVVSSALPNVIKYCKLA